jgi:hypothetical protein
MQSNKIIPGLLVLLVILILAVCICFTTWLAGAYFLLRRVSPVQPSWQAASVLTPSVESATSTPHTNTPIPPISTDSPEAFERESPKPGLADLSPFQGAQETLETLENTLVSINDLIELAERLGGISIHPPAGSIAPTPEVGASHTFWIMDIIENRNFQVPARLVYSNDRLYFWVQEGTPANLRLVKNLADTFAEEIIPTNRRFFGSEWNPGIDGDPRLHILYARGIGNSIAGYFSSMDELPPEINEFSNAREMFLLNADTSPLDRPFTYGVLAHEFQHMIHWYQDRNEETWMNEGFANLATFLNGYTIGGSDLVYAGDTDIQLNDWPAEPDPPHYGASFLLLTYFLDRFGEKATQAVVANPANGLVSIDQVLEEINARDGITGKSIQADDVFIDWAVANYLQNRRVADGRYTYTIYPTAPKVGATEVVRDCPTGPQHRQVHQYGIDYLRIRCQGNYLLKFSGAELVKLLPTHPPSGSYFFWSNQGDESDMTLTRPFDFSTVTGSLTLSYSTWYDIEKGFDHVYLLASQDGGESWQILSTPSGSLEDLSGSGFGWSYTGQSHGEQNGWVQEQVDLSSFAGEEVLLRFEYVTDSAVNGNGFALDDISIPEIGYASDFEADAGGWQPDGFVRIQNALPQTYRLALIEKGSTTRVSYVEVQGESQVEIPFQTGGQVDEIILVVAGTTRITRQAAQYQFEINSALGP